MTLSTEVVYLIGLNLLDNPNEIGAVGQVPIVEGESGIAVMRILVKVIDPTGVETTCAPLDPMYLIALLQ